jgi:hypothetical protein
MIDFLKEISNIKTKDDFISLVELLVQDLKKSPQSWTNKNLEDYLGAIANWTEDMEGFYLNNNLEIPKDIPWKVFANILVAAMIYE